MSAKLTGIIRDIKVGPRLATHKVALFVLADDGKAHGVVSISLEEIMDAAEISKRQATKLRGVWQRMGIIRLVHKGGIGPGDQNTYAVNLDVLRAMGDGSVSYEARWLEITGGKGELECTLNPPNKGELECTLDARNKGEAKSELKGEAKGELKGELSPPSSSKSNYIYIPDDDGAGAPPVELPEWALAEVEKLEPDRWPLLAEAFLRWDGSRKAVDIGKAFVGWARRMLGIERKRGAGATLEPGDWARIYAMAGISTRTERDANPAELAKVRDTRAALLAANWRARRTASPAIEGATP